jgi:hypothetical protein
MAARIGNVLYWLGCAIAAFFVLLIVILATNPTEDASTWTAIYGLLGIGSFVLGRFARYFLAGPRIDTPKREQQ